VRIGRFRSERSKGSAASLLTLCVALLVAGCGQGEWWESFELEVVEATELVFEAENAAGHRVVVNSETGYIELPFDRFVLIQFSAVLDRFDNALDKLAIECMDDLGLEFSFGERPIRPWESNHLRRYGVFSRELAAAYGYGLTPTPELDAIQAGQAGPMSQAIEEGLLGGAAATADGVPIPTGGCMAQAARSLESSSVLGDPAFSLAQDIGAGTWRVALEDERVATKIREWQACMAERGITETGEHPIDFAASVASSGFPADEEIEIALIDVDCKTETQLVQVWAAAEAELQAELYLEQPDAFDAVNAGLIQLAEESAEVVGSDLPDVSLLRTGDS